jgi:hypothetical protein
MTIFEIKNMLGEVNRRLDDTEVNISELEDIAIENSHNATERKIKH